MTVFSLIIVFAVTVADRLTKSWATSFLAQKNSVSVIPNIFSFSYTENSGAAFSILNKHTWILCVISVVFCVALIVWWIVKKPKNKLLCTAVSLVFSGALGNAYDRIVYGYVVDFIKTDFISFPIFNIADIAITIGVVLLVVYILFFDKTNS